MKKILIFVLITVLGIQSKANIEYRLKYNTITNVFEVYFVSDATIAGPANVGSSYCTIVFEPSFDVTTLTTTSFNGGTWSSNDKVTGNTGTLDTYKVVGWNSAGNPIAGGVTAGTEVLLFNFTFGGGGGNCVGGKMRAFDNVADPADPNGAGGDFTSYLNLAGTDLFSTTSGTTMKDCIGWSTVPVHFLTFNAVKDADNALLTWKVENESSITDHYEILRSLNGSTFEYVSSVSAALNGNPSNDYFYKDLKITALPQQKGAVYYRIKQVDRDAKNFVTPIRSVRLDNKFGVTLYPNPSKGKSVLSLDLLDNTTVTTTVVNAAGQELQRTQFAAVKGLNMTRIDFSALPAGTYLLKVQAGDEIKTLSVVRAK